MKLRSNFELAQRKDPISQNEASLRCESPSLFLQEFVGCSTGLFFLGYRPFECAILAV